jgi:hypothetical protein
MIKLAQFLAYIAWTGPKFFFMFVCYFKKKYDSP